MKSLYKSVLFTVGMMIGAFAFGQTTVSSIISSNQTWTAAGSPYLLSSNALIEQGVTVTVEPGTIIQGGTSLYRLIVDGEFKAIGKKDSAITIKKITVEFSKKAVDYDSSSKTGSQFQYVYFEGSSTGGDRSIYTTSTSLLVRNCKFIDGYYNIYAYSSYPDTIDVFIENSVFRGVTNKYGYACYASGGNIRLFMTDCYADNLYGMYLPYTATIIRSSFNNMSSYNAIYASNIRKLKLQCNSFTNFPNTVLNLYFGKDAEVEITQNTFDSGAYFMSIGSYKPAKFVVENNNFLFATKNTIKISGGSTPGKADTLNFKNNYWGTTNAAAISGGIWDFADDITIGGYVDYSNYLSAAQTTCSLGGTIGGADTSSIHGGQVAVQNIQNTRVKMYPNPASNQVHFDFNGEKISTIRMFDLQGKLIVEESVLNNNHTLYLNSINDGLYLLELSGDNKVAQQKLVVKH
ncbi:MAG: T9SS type A sorting domain-containing protein [Flavobacteriales bacterium]|nr:T9SS type A sorting domain-containing protein [Flavobacteriales bacterium]